MIPDIDRIQGSFRGRLFQNELMSRHTSLKVGGPADIFAVPEDLDDLQHLISCLKDADIPWMAIGGGYNLLVRDGGLRCAVISLKRINSVVQLGDGLLRAWAGAENIEVVRYGQKLGLGGVGFISGIPGTIGGAVRMNAGAYGSGLLEHADSLTLLKSGTVTTLPMIELEYGYRRLALEDSDIILAVTLRLEQKNPEETEDEIRKDLELRRSKHNVGFPSAGSFFKNPEGVSAWRLIDAAGMRGSTVGGAMVSGLHSNFLVNTGGATATDFLELAAMVKGAVEKSSGHLLEEEVKIVGEDP